jgi:signal transduction histidine kinase
MIDGIFPASPERLNYLNEEVVRFARLLNNLNALKEFESESVELNFENIELDKMVQAICRDFYISAKNKNIKIDFYARSRQGYVVREDRDKLKQVFINLISNAVKFTEKQGEIHVSLMGSEEQVIVKIKDNGIGIKKEDLPYIFERLYRGDKSRHEIAGSGLGLTIVKNILQFHSANINVESKEGEGTTFKVYFIKNKQISNWRKQTNERAI